MFRLRKRQEVVSEENGIRMKMKSWGYKYDFVMSWEEVNEIYGKAVQEVMDAKKV